MTTLFIASRPLARAPAARWLPLTPARPLRKEILMMHSRFLHRSALIAILLATSALIPGAVLAQSATATLRGVVHDESGNIFPGAEITATSLERGYRQSATA